MKAFYYYKVLFIIRRCFTIQQIEAVETYINEYLTGYMLSASDLAEKALIRKCLIISTQHTEEEAVNN